jgi:glucosamine--fructose-6-phosphate aminotransferase (isomerizing)
VLKDVTQVLIIACGTSYHAGMVARYWIEAMAGVPCNVEVASEYRYRETVPDPKTLVVTLSQSGETADTLAALEHAKSLGMTKTLCICNVPESSLVRANALRFITRAGPEIGVASTKAFTTQLASLYLLTLIIAKLRGRLTEAMEAKELSALRHLPAAVSDVLELEPQIREWAERFAMKPDALFLGRGRHYPIAMEGALKLKEILHSRRGVSGRRAEARAAGARRQGNAGDCRCAERRAAGKAEIEPAGGARARRRIVRFCRRRQRHALVRRRARHPAARALRAACRRCCTSSRCSCSPTTRRWCAAPTSTSRATWRNR